VLKALFQVFYFIHLTLQLLIFTLVCIRFARKSQANFSVKTDYYYKLFPFSNLVELSAAVIHYYSCQAFNRVRSKFLWGREGLVGGVTNSTFHSHPYRMIQHGRHLRSGRRPANCIKQYFVAAWFIHWGFPWILQDSVLKIFVVYSLRDITKLRWQ
jgi:hypothetical protein